MPAGISFAAGKYHTRRVYHKSTQWISIIAKSTCFRKCFLLAEWEGFEPSDGF